MTLVEFIPSELVIASDHHPMHEIRINNQIISPAMVAAEMQYHPAESQREALLKAAESLIISELLRQRAVQLGLTIDAETSEDFIEPLLAAEVAIPQASETELVRYYQANLPRFMSSPLLEARHILLASAPDDEEGRVAGKERAAVLLDALRSGADFSALAVAESACPSKALGGSLGQISRGQTVTEFERQVFATEPGLLSRAVETRYGFHIVFVERKVPGAQLPFSAVKDTIADYLNEKVRVKAIAQYIQTLISAADIEGFDFGVSQSPLMQ